MSVVPEAFPDSIGTPRLLLRRPSADDARAIFDGYAQDERVCRYMIWSPHREVAETERFIAGCIDAWEVGGRLAYVLADADTGAAFGMLEARVQGSTVDIGYVLARPLWGRGLMPEAIGALASAALAQPQFFRMQATCDVTNTASARTLEKAGFAREGRLERHTIHPNLSPEPRACFMYARVR
jgi:RimJ/RimL family protein N-acetyltransferase